MEENKTSRKPIFIVGFPASADAEAIRQVYSDLDRKLGEDYHVLTYRAQTLEDIEFKLLNVIDADDIAIADLIAKTREEIESLLKQAAPVDLTGIVDEIIKKNQQ